MPRARRAARILKPAAEAAPPRVQTVFVSVDDVVPYPNNPRHNETAIPMIARSIQRFGFVQPILLTDDNVIIAGHTRLEGAKMLGMTEVPAIYASHMSEEDADAFRIIDNKLAEQATWDNDLLGAEVTRLRTLVDFTDYGYTQEALDCLQDVVADDCLEAGVAVGEESAAQRNEARGPLRTRFVVGEFVFYTSTDCYRRWANQVRTECDFSEAGIQQHLKDLLGLTGYEDE